MNGYFIYTRNLIDFFKFYKERKKRFLIINRFYFFFQVIIAINCKYLRNQSMCQKKKQKPSVIRKSRVQ